MRTAGRGHRMIESLWFRLWLAYYRRKLAISEWWWVKRHGSNFSDDYWADFWKGKDS